jgi:hypothetical protein
LFVIELGRPINIPYERTDKTVENQGDNGSCFFGIRYVRVLGLPGEEGMRYDNTFERALTSDDSWMYGLGVQRGTARAANEMMPTLTQANHPPRSKRWDWYVASGYNLYHAKVTEEINSKTTRWLSAAALSLENGERVRTERSAI